MSVFTNPATGAEGSAQAYTEATLTLLGDRDPIAVLEEGPAAFRDLVSGHAPEVLGRPEATGKWSAAATLQHMADSDTVWAVRLRMVLAHDRPTLAGYDQDAWARTLGYAHADAAAALDRFDVLRSANLSLLAALRADQWDRVSFHDERGEESVRHMVRLYAGHDLVHRRQVARILG
jgi:uncharacterized damage-inducible protein DinB